MCCGGPTKDFLSASHLEKLILQFSGCDNLHPCLIICGFICNCFVSIFVLIIIIIIFLFDTKHVVRMVVPCCKKPMFIQNIC